MALGDYLRKLRQGRRRAEPTRDTQPFPAWALFGGQVAARRQTAIKPTPRRLRAFAQTPIARRALNSIKNRIAMLDWEVVPADGIALNSEIRRQIDVVSRCLNSPNEDDSMRTLTETVLEDILIGAGAIEIQTGADPDRPLWMWPTDGLAIQIYPGWSGGSTEARYVQTIGTLANTAGSTQGILLRNDELIYIRPNPSTATPFGHGPLEIAFETISRLLGVAEFAGKVASNGLPAFGIDLGPNASPEETLQFRTYWTNEVEGEGKVPIWAMGGAGAGVATTGTAAGAHAQVQRFYPEGDNGLYLKYQELLTRVAAAAFDISPANLNIERDVNRSTAEVAEERDWESAIKPYAMLYAQHLNREAIRGKLGFSQIEFRYPTLRREDERAKAEIHKIYYGINVLSPNDIREELGRSPQDGPWGDKLLVDVDIAKNAARSAGLIEDPDLPKQDAPASTGAPTNPKPVPEPGKE